MQFANLLALRFMRSEHARGSRLWATLAVILFAGALIAGIGAFRSLTADDTHLPPAAAPLPGGNLAAVHQHVADSSRVPDPEHMGHDTIAIADLRIYAPLVSVSVRQSDVVVPFDAHKIGIYDQAAPLASTDGTTTLVGHVTNGSIQGSLYPLAAAEPGMTIWTRDGGNDPQAWDVRAITIYPRTELPDELFKSSGQRRLILITCGGEVTQSGSARHYADNVVVEAIPAPSRQHHTP